MTSLSRWCLVSVRCPRFTLSFLVQPIFNYSYPVFPIKSIFPSFTNQIWAKWLLLICLGSFFKIWSTFYYLFFCFYEPLIIETNALHWLKASSMWFNGKKLDFWFFKNVFVLFLDLSGARPQRATPRRRSRRHRCSARPTSAGESTREISFFLSFYVFISWSPFLLGLDSFYSPFHYEKLSIYSFFF